MCAVGLAAPLAGSGQRSTSVRRGTVAGMRAESLATLDALERAWAARANAGNRESKALLAQIRRQRARLIQTA